jgi:hypothetical protein
VAARRHPSRPRRAPRRDVGRHPGARRRSVADREKAWYQLLFQFEGTAEELLRRDDWALFREWLRDDGDTDRYVEDLARPGALTAGLNWYRANLPGLNWSSQQCVSGREPSDGRQLLGRTHHSDSAT